MCNAIITGLAAADILTNLRNLTEAGGCFEREKTSAVFRPGNLQTIDPNFRQLSPIFTESTMKSHVDQSQAFVC